MMRVENSHIDEIFNNTDYGLNDWNAFCKVAEAIKPHPRNYFIGLPDCPVALPKNILLFSRQKAFDHGQGTAHHRFLLIFCLQGEGSVIVDDEVSRLQPGYVLLVTPLQFHHYARFNEGKLLWLFLSFELDAVDEFSALQGRAVEMTHLQITCLRQLARRYAALDEEQAPSSELTLLAALLLQEFRITATPSQNSNFTTSQSPPPSRGLIQDVASYVHSHVTDAIQIPEVARAVGYSESHLRARFQALAGIGLGTYIRQLRLHRARTMMLVTELRLKEIAERCGYESIYTFSRTFRKEMGVSPSRYRQQTRKNGI
ncbi:MAG: AraC family transcriptional regulator [bacterium]|jgi:AraC-like DNA-binding protein